MKTIQPTLYLFIAILFVVVFGFSIFSDGMFFDGIFYASIANNYANGIGTFWEMQYTTTLHTQFHEQPPLALFLQAQFFTMLGDSIYVERLYCFLFSLFTLFMLTITWKEFTEKNYKHFWISLLFWMCIPLNSWTFQNNLIEVTMISLDLCAVYFILKGCKRDSLALQMWGGLFTFLAFFSKGFQGLFPLVTPIFYWWMYRPNSFWRSSVYTVVVTAIPVLLATALYYYPPSHQGWEMYLKRRLVGTFHHLQDTTKSHFYLLYKLILELLVPIILCGLSWWLSRKNVTKITVDRKAVFLLTGIGLSASLPLMITLEQRPFYLTTSFPYFVLAISLVAFPSILVLLEKIKGKNFTLLNYILLVLLGASVLFGIVNAHKPKRDQLLIRDLATIGDFIPKRTTISVSPDMITNWAYHAYFMRYNNISLDDKPNHPFYLSGIDGPAPIDSCYQQENMSLNKFKVFECK